METVIFDGTSYVRAATVAKRFKYTTDYVGQLCRNKKVDARLVGRVWYVNLDSVQAYRKGRHGVSKTAATAVRKKSDSEKSNNTDIYKVAIKKISVNRTRDKFIKPTPTLESHVAKVISYQVDDEALLPELRSARKFAADTAVSLPISTADTSKSHRVRVAIEPDVSPMKLVKESKSTEESPDRPEKQRPVVVSVEATENHIYYTGEALPSVLLRGKLSVVDATDSAVEQLEDEERMLEVVVPEKKRNFLLRVFLFFTAPIRFVVRKCWQLFNFFLIRPVLFVFRVVSSLFSRLRPAPAARTVAAIAKQQPSFSPQQVRYAPPARSRSAVFFWVGLLAVASVMAGVVISLGLETIVEGGETATVPFFDSEWLPR